MRRLWNWLRGRDIYDERISYVVGVDPAGAIATVTIMAIDFAGNITIERTHTINAGGVVEIPWPCEITYDPS